MDILKVDDEIIEVKNKATVTLCCNKIGDLENRYGTYSNEFEPVETTENLAKLDLIKSVQNTSKKPYKKNKASLSINGTEVMPEGFAKIVNGKIILYSGIIDLTTQLEGKKLRDLDLSALDHTWSLANIVSLNSTQGNIIYPLIDWHSDSNPTNNYIDGALHGIGSIDARTLFACISILYIIQQIIKDTTYTISGDVLSETKLTNQYLPFSLDKLEYAEEFIKNNEATMGFISSDIELIPVSSFIIRSPLGYNHALNGTFNLVCGGNIVFSGVGYILLISSSATPITDPAFVGGTYNGIWYYPGGTYTGVGVITGYGICLTTQNLTNYNYEYDAYTVSSQYFVNFDNGITFNVAKIFKNTNNNFNINTGEYICAFKGIYTFELSLYWSLNIDILPILSSTISGSVQFAILKNGTAIGTSAAIPFSQAGVVNSFGTSYQTTLITTTSNCNKNDQITARVVNIQINGLPTNSLNFVNVLYANASWFEITIDPAIQWGGDIFANQILPDMSQLDFLKTVLLQPFGLIPKVDNVNKDIELVYFKKYYDNIPKAKDWTDKMVKGDYKPITEENNTAKKNWFKYKPDTNLPRYNTTGIGDSYFNIDNENLPKETIVLQSPFSASIEVNRFGLGANAKRTVRIPKLTSGAMVNKTELKIIMLDYKVAQGTIQYYDGSNPALASYYSTIMPLAYFDDSTMQDNLSFANLINQNYYEYANFIFKQYKKLKIPFWLNVRDINKFDFFIPIYLKQFASNFIVEEISEFEETSPTTVTLVKM